MVHDMKTLLVELDVAGVSPPPWAAAQYEASKAVGGLCGNLTSSEAHKCWSPLCPTEQGLFRKVTLSDSPFHGSSVVSSQPGSQEGQLS